MIFISTISVTVLVLVMLEKRGKVSLNEWIIKGLLFAICLVGMAYIFLKAGETFFLF